MKSEAELRKAFDELTWFVDGDDGKPGRIRRQDFATQMNVLGSLAVLEWALGLERDGNPIVQTLKDIAVMRQGPERN